MVGVAPEDLGAVILEVAHRLREAGVRIGTSEIVHAERIARDYALLSGQKRIPLEELVNILSSAWPSASLKRDLLGSELERILSSRNVEKRATKIYEELRESIALIGGRPGDSVSLKKSLRGRKKERTRIKAAYVKLKRVGAIHRRQGRDRIADEADLRRIALRLAREGYSSVEDAVRDKPPRTRDEVLLQLEAGISIDKDRLRSESEHRLLRTGWAAVKKHDYRTQRAVADVLRERIIRGEPVRDPDAVIEFLKRTHSLSSDILVSMLSRGEPVEGLEIDTIARIVSSLPDDVAGQVIAKYRKRMSPGDYIELLRRTDPRKLWSLGDRRVPGDRNGVYQALGAAARAVREALEYAESLDPGRADMSLYYAERAETLASGSPGDRAASSAMSLARAARTLVALIDGFGPGISQRDIVEALARLDLADSLVVMRSLYTKASTAEERRVLVESMDRLLARYTARSGLLPMGRRVYSTVRGRLDVRRTIYNMVRMKQSPLVFYRKARTRPLALALDVSSSMIPYSAWALAVASVFARHIEKIVMFSDSIEVYTGPFTRREIARILLEASFGGRTDISRALDVAADKLAAKRIVVVSDLSQTVDGEPPWQTVSALSKRGVKIVFITHEKHDREAKRLIESEGGKVIVARSAREAATRFLSVAR
ncbi:MAG: VWA domain-containing protein [Desulfurococcales archaeon]|nr:VWA domain-containing protein [Desulfurococcales archaeon]